jgi:beta-phosphoglucomutase-like phosphatase (HAD superfamily)
MDAVIFDCDGVLIDSETIAHEVEMRALKTLGLVFDPEDYRRKFQGLAVKSWRRFLDEDHRAQLGKPLPDPFIDTLCAEITRAILTDIRPIDGAVSAVRAFEGAKSVASSSPGHELKGKIAGLGLAADFGDHVYSGDDVEHGKPAPDLFLLASSRLAISPSRCLVIEDSGHGVTAAVAAGMIVWGFVGGPHCSPDQAQLLEQNGARRVFKHMNEIAAALRAL